MNRESIIKQMFLTPGRGGRPSRKIVPEALIIHWTANTDMGAHAEANRNYFENHPEKKVSAHYCVDDVGVIQCLPEDEMGYHAGAANYLPGALSKLSLYPNECTLGIEMCVNADGDFRQTYRNTVLLAADIMNRHGWHKTSVLLRHYDMTGKDCPRFFIDDVCAQQYGFKSAVAGWKQFKADVAAAQQELKATKEYRFGDILGHWAEKQIAAAIEKGLFIGDGTGFFRPENSATRAELAVVAMRLEERLLAEMSAAAALEVAAAADTAAANAAAAVASAVAAAATTAAATAATTSATNTAATNAKPVH